MRSALPVAHRASRLAALAAAPLLLVPSQAGAQTLSLEVRAGVVVSTALAEDAVASTSLRQRLGERFAGPVRASPAPGPGVSIAAVSNLRARTRVELAVGWSFTRLEAEEGGARRAIQDVGIAQASLGIRYMVRDRLDASCGFGAAHYIAGDGGLFAGGTGLTPLVECGTGLTTAGPGKRFLLRATAQAQRFRTGVLSDAAARTGTVLRFAIQAGIAVPVR